MRILIVGCGWVGEFVAKKWLSQGHQVYATTRTEDKYHRLTADGIFAFIHDFDQQEQTLILPEDKFDWVITSIPATQKHDLPTLKLRFTAVSNLLQSLKYTKHIFLSSVGIYPDIDGEVSEDTIPEVDLQPKLRLAETLIQQADPKVYIFRLGGLFGQQRIFAKYFQNRVCETGEQPANFIHLQDVEGILMATLKAEPPISSGAYNLVCPIRPRKKEVIIASAEKYHFDLPSAFIPADLPAKSVSGTRIQQALNYSFIYTNPIDF